MSSVIVKKLDSYDREIECMPDKSMSIRAVLFNAFATGSATVCNLLPSDDVKSAIDCVRRLGASVEIEDGGKTAHITGAPFSGCELDCGNSGTTARLLIGLLSGLHGTYTLKGDASLSSRPMRRVIEPLRRMGARITDTDGFLPVTVTGTYLRGGITYDSPIASAQVKSALMLAGLNAAKPITINEPTKSRDHSENMLACMGGRVSVSGNSVTVSPSVLYARDFTVPGDISSAAYPICLALMTGGRCYIKNVGINPTRTGLVELLCGVGANIEYENVTGGAEPRADVSVTASKLRPFTVGGELVPRLIDEIPVLCALACFIDGTSVIKDAKELRVKETDRIATTVAALGALGADIEPTDDGMVIHGGKPLVYGTVHSELDHRIAMSAAVAGAAGAGAEIIDADCASVSYPDFYKEVIGETCASR